MDTQQLENRDSSRRAAIHYMRIEESRDYLDTFLCAFRELSQAQRRALFSGSRAVRMKAFEEIAGLIHAAAKKQFHLRSLDDMLLTELDDKLMMTVWGKTGSIADSVNKLRTHSSLSNDLLEQMSEQHQNAIAFIRGMQTRLDQLARTLP